MYPDAMSVKLNKYWESEYQTQRKSLKSGEARITPHPFPISLRPRCIRKLTAHKKQRRNEENMKKRIIVFCLLGAPIGLAISTWILIIISLTVGDGNFYPVVPELINDCGSELNAVLLQTLLSMLYGAVFAGASLIWKIDSFSLLKQTVLHLLICSLATFPIAYTTRWMSHDLKGILLYFGTFFSIYVIIWLFLYRSIKKRILQINARLQETNDTNLSR